MTVFQVVVHGPGEAPQAVDVSRSPWTIGRAKDSALCLARPGIFERHLIVRAEAGEGLVVEVAPGAIARVGDQEFRRHRVRNGDLVRIGSVTLGFVLAPAKRRALGIWGAVYWILLGVLILAQTWVVIRLAP